MKSQAPLRFCIATLALVMPAAADVIYSNLLNTEIPLDFEGVTVDIDSGQLNPFFGGVGVANNASLQPFRQGTGGLDTILNFSFGSTIGGGNTFLSSGDGGSQTHLGTTFTAGQEGFIGFKLNNQNYGWARVVFTNNTGGAVVRDWAYDNGGSGIAVGGIRQVGHDIVLSSGFGVASNLQDSDATATNLTQSGNFTNSLTGTNTYTGSTLVSQGTLSVDGTGSINNSAVAINGGTFLYNSSVAYSGNLNFTSGTLGGTNHTGSLGGLEIGSNQILSPADSTGTAITTSQTWTGGGTYLWEINDAAGSAGSATGWDLVSGSGALAITANSESPFTIAITSLGLNQVEGDATGFNDLSSYNWLIADFTSTVTGFTEDAIAIDTSGFANTFTGIFGVARGSSIAGGDSSQIYLTYSVIPEPSAALLAALGMTVLLRRRVLR